METNLLQITPVIPSQDIERDVLWYKKNIGFECISKNNMYAVLKRENLFIHLQWHADNENDPLLGGSVIKIFVQDIQPIFSEFINKGIVNKDKLQLSTSWNTNEFGLYDLNNNAIFIVESIKKTYIK